MMTKIKADMKAALARLDGVTPEQVVAVMADSSLNTLSDPSPDMQRVGSVTLWQRAGVVVPYEHTAAAFAAMINEARRN